MIALIDWPLALGALATFAFYVIVLLLACIAGSWLFGWLAQYLYARHEQRDARRRNRL